MNYRHAFHAGSFSDVVKHVILTRIIEYMKLKPASFRVLDTHAGIGRYDLTGEAAQRSPEWRDGVQKLFNKGLPADAAALVEPYVDAVRRENRGNALTAYPGSPLIARKLLRPQDRLEAIELHPDDALALKAQFDGDPQVRVVALDGWLALGANLPPIERRGVVLVDPPFEVGGEFDRMVEGLVKAHRRFATGIYALWYPLKEPRHVNAFVANLKDIPIDRMLRTELTIARPSTLPRLFGSGMIVVNPPFTLEAELRVILPALASLFGEAGRGNFKLEWLRAEPEAGRSARG